MGQHGLSLFTRLANDIAINDDGCWIWTKSINSSGYGLVRWKGVYIYVHRAAYVMFVGPIEEGFDVGHKCHDRAALAGLCAGGRCIHQTCCNPEHLKSEPRRDNLLASPLTRASINAAKTHCKRNHPFDEENTRLKKNGWRSCKTCGRMSKEERAEWDRAHPQP